MRTTTAVGLAALLAAVSLAGCLADPDRKVAEEKVRIGIYDSRAIATAWTGTKLYLAETAAARDELQKAGTAGDVKRVAALQAEAISRRQRLHLQTVSAAAVDDILARYPEGVAGVKEKTRVKLLVARWDESTLAEYPYAELVDVSMMLVDAMMPSEGQRLLAADVMGKRVLSLDQAQRMKGW